MALDTQNTSELTQEQVAAILTQPLEQASVFLAAGPRIIDTAGPLRIPSAPGATELADKYWIGENELIPEYDADLSEVSLLPSTMKSIKVLTRYSNELARQAIVALDATLQDRLVRDVANKVDAQLLSDKGDGIHTPRGIFAWEGVHDTAVGGPLNLDALMAAQGTALAGNVDPSTLRLFVRPENYMGLRSLKDGDGRYMLDPAASSAGTASVLGTPIVVSNRIPAGRAALLDMSTVVVARDVMPSVKLLDQRYGEYDQQAIRVVTRYDAAPTVPGSVFTLSGLTAK